MDVDERLDKVELALAEIQSESRDILSLVRLIVEGKLLKEQERQEDDRARRALELKAHRQRIAVAQICGYTVLLVTIAGSIFLFYLMHASVYPRAFWFKVPEYHSTERLKEEIAHDE